MQVKNSTRRLANGERESDIATRWREIGSF